MIEMTSHWRLCRKGYNWLSWGNNNLLVCSMYVSCHFEFFTWSWLSISRLIWKVIYFSTKLQTRFIMVQQSSRIFSVKSNNTKSLYPDIIFHKTECLFTLQISYPVTIQQTAMLITTLISLYLLKYTWVIWYTSIRSEATLTSNYRKKNNNNNH